MTGDRFSRLCKVCGTLIDPAAGEVHPSCDPAVAHEYRRDLIREAARRKGTEGSARALARVETTARAWAMSEIRKLCNRQQFVSADDVRDEFAAYGLPPTAMAGLWRAAVKRGWCRAADEHTSSGESAHGKKINSYLSLTYRPGEQASA